MHEIDLARDGWLKLAIGTLWFCGACYALLGLCVPAVAVLGLLPTEVRSADKVVLGVMAVLSLGLGLGCALGNFVAAWGLAKRKKWAYVVTVIIAAMYAPSRCMPFGLVLLYAMLRRGVKEAYEAESAARAA